MSLKLDLNREGGHMSNLNHNELYLNSQHGGNERCLSVVEIEAIAQRLTCMWHLNIVGIFAGQLPEDSSTCRDAVHYCSRLQSHSHTARYPQQYDSRRMPPRS